jgi:hypothetical protein
LFNHRNNVILDGARAAAIAAGGENPGAVGCAGPTTVAIT